MSVTSGQINSVIVTRDEIIVDALEDIEAISDGGTPAPGDLVKGARKLNMLLKLWGTKGRLLWCLDTITIPCQTNKSSYTIGPQGDVVSYRPLRAFEGTYIRYTNAGVNNDTQLTLISRLEYEQYANKGSTGYPNTFYYDPVMTSTPTAAYNPQNAAGKLSLFNTPVDATRSIFLKVQRPIQDITNSSDAFDLPVEWYNALSKNLAVELCAAYGVPIQRKQMLMQDAKAALEEIVDWAATEEAPFTFQPDYQMTMGRR